MENIGQLFDINKLYEDFNLPYWKDFKINRKDASKIETQGRIKAYLRQRGYPLVSLMTALMVIKKTRKPQSRHYYQITIPILLDVVFHEKEGYEFGGKEVKEAPIKTVVKPLRNGKEWYQLKTKVSQNFVPTEKYKTPDEFASFATDAEIENYK